MCRNQQGHLGQSLNGVFEDGSLPSHLAAVCFGNASQDAVSVSVSVRHRIQMTGDKNGVGGRVRFLAYRLVVIGVFFNFGFEGRNGL